jgi:hypothetical protein
LVIALIALPCSVLEVAWIFIPIRSKAVRVAPSTCDIGAVKVR